MITYGVVFSVSTVPLGDSLSVAATSGGSSLTLYGAYSFAELGGTLRIGGDDPAAQIVAYTAADLDTNIITLGSTLAASWAVDTPVEVWDPTSSAVFTDYRALVAELGDVDNDDSLDCSVAHSLIPLLPEGIRGPGDGESVTLTADTPGEWTVTDLHGRTPSFDGGKIKPGTISPLQMTFGPVTIGNTAPVSPHVGDVWFDGTNGYLMNQWSGSAWVPATFGTNAITAGSITSNLIAANAIVAGAIAAGALDAQTITAGALTAGSVSAGSIGASQILASGLTDCDITIDPDGGTMLVYAISGTTTTTLTTVGAGSFSVPAGVTSVKVECWGAGGGGGGGARISNFGSVGGCGGEYARVDNWAVTPLASVPYVIGAGGAAGSVPGGDGGAGGLTYFDNTVTGVIAHGGVGSFQSWKQPGASGSTNQFHFNGGGNGGSLWQTGGGGGSSGGTSRSGNSGTDSTSNSTPGSGGAAVPGGGAGGNGGAGTGGGVQAGSAPGGGGGGGGGLGGGHSAGAGARGQIRLTYGGTRVLVASIAGVAGTDQYGNSYPAGVRTNYAPASVGLTGGYYEERDHGAQTLTGNTTRTMNANNAVQLISDYGAATSGNTTWTAPADGLYVIDAGFSLAAPSPAPAGPYRAFMCLSSGAAATGTFYRMKSRFCQPTEQFEDTVHLLRRFSAGDTVYFSGYQNSGANVSTIASRNSGISWTRLG